MQDGPRTWTVIVAAAIVAGVAGLCSGAVGGFAAGLWSAKIDADDDRPAVPAPDDIDADADVPWTAAAAGTDAVVHLDAGADEHHLRFEIPADAVAVRVEAESGHGFVHLSVRCSDDDGAPWDSRTSWTESPMGESLHPVAFVSTFGTPALVPGPFEVCVRADEEPDGPTEVRVRVRVVRTSVEAVLAPGASWTGTTNADSGFVRSFTIPVPQDADAIRIDLADCDDDLDVHVSAQGPVACASDADASADTTTTCESLVLDGASDPPLPRGGTLHVTVADPVLGEAPVGFRILVTAGSAVPAELATPPRIEIPADPRVRALLCVAELVVEGGGGSGTFVSEDGLVLTARHVVEEAAEAVESGRPGDAPTIVVAVTTDPREIARDLFRAEVVRSDAELDLAMLRCTATVRGTPIPKGYTFPFAKVSRRTSLRAGDPLVVVGYPDAAGTGSRVSQTVSRGVLSGWSRTARVHAMKTDAFVSPGSSGGAAFDERWELAGVPVSTTGGDSGAEIGHLMPVDAVPEAWWR